MDGIIEAMGFDCIRIADNRVRKMINNIIPNKKKKKEILIVEDSPTQALKLKYLLEEHNFSYVWAKNGLEALNKIKENKPDLIVSDIVMPKMDGYELCRNIKTDNTLKNIPVILLTALTGTKNIIKGLDVNADFYITKPYEENFFISKINLLLSKKITEQSDVDEELEIILDGKTHKISANRKQILNLLLSTHENLVFQNQTLTQTQEALRKLNESLEEKVRGKTAHLLAEITDRKQAEEALRESKERFRVLAESTSDWIWEVDENAVYTYASPKVKALLGYEPEEIIGKTPFDLMIPEDAKRVAGEFGAIAEARKPFDRLENESLHKDGRILVLDTSGVPIFDANGNFRGYRGIDRDFTERKRAEDALRKSEERFRTIFDSLNDAVFIHDVQTGAILDVNSTMCEMYGYSREEVDQLDVQALSSGEVPYTQQDALEWIKKAVAGKRQVFEWMAKHKSGHLFWVEVSIKKAVVGLQERLLVVARDITERVQAEKALKESEEKYKTLYDSSRDAIMIVSSDTGFLSGNPATIKMFGCQNEDEFIFQTLAALSPEYQPDGALSLEKSQKMISIAMEQGSHFFEWKHKRVDGEEFHATVLLTRMKLYGEKVLQATVRDVTKRKKLEAQLRQAQKMEAIGTLAGGVAHDFNNLLTVIIGNAQLALMEGIKDESLRKGIEETRKAGKRGASLTRQLLAFSRKQIITPRVLDLNELLTGIEKMLARLIGEDVELLTIPEPALWQVEVDPGQMEQVIMNLAVNASDAMPRGGKLTIETANIGLAENYFHEHGIKNEPGSYVMLAVSDTGSGMDKKTREHIFEPFFTTKEVGKGTGLGLSTVYGIVKQSNGFVWAYSQPGQGTTFKVYLPKVERDADSEEKQRLPVIELDGSETILIVEDDDGLRKFAQNALQMHGYRVLDAENGENALKIGKEHEGPIHLMITDVVMPRMSGKEAAERLQPFYPRMKVIYMSGYTDKAIVEHGVLAPGLNFLQKPFSPESLAHKVRGMLDQEDLER